MLRSRSDSFAVWFAWGLVFSVAACAAESNQAPNPAQAPRQTGSAGASGSQNSAGAASGGMTSSGGGSPQSGSGGSNAMSSGGSAGTAAAPGDQGGMSNGGSNAAGGSVGMGGAAHALGGSGGTTGASGHGGTIGAAGKGGSSTGGSAAGAGPVVIYARDYQFDSNTAPFSLSQYGSTPNIGSAGGPEKLSAQSTLSLDGANGSPKKGSARLGIPFSQYDEQLDLNSGFDTARENWTGYKANARIKIVSGGNADSSCPLRAWIYITATSGYTFGRGTAVDVTSAWQDMTYDFAAPAEGNPDLTAVNQLGIQLSSNTASNCAGNPSFSKATIVIDDFQVHKP